MRRIISSAEGDADALGSIQTDALGSCAWGWTSPPHLAPPAAPGAGFGAGGAEGGGIQPQEVGMGWITRCSLDSSTTRDSHSCVFHILSKWSDIKLVKGLNLSKVRPAVTVCWLLELGPPLLLSSLCRVPGQGPARGPSCHGCCWSPAAPAHPAECGALLRFAGRGRFCTLVFRWSSCFTYWVQEATYVFFMNLESTTK